MKLKKLMILFSTVCMLNTMAVGCGSATESAVKTEEARSGEILPEEESPSSDADIPDSQLIHVMFEEDTRFYMRNTDEDGESHEYKEAGYQDLNEHMFVEMKGSFVNDEFHATEIRFF